MPLPETQIVFNIRKGSVPVRLNLDTSSMDMCAQLGMKAPKDPVRHIPNRGYVASPDRIEATRDVVPQFWNKKSMMADGFVARLITALKPASEGRPARSAP